MEKSLPSYRILHGTIKARNLREWIPVQFPTSEFRDLVSTHDLRESVGQIEALVKRDGHLVFGFTPEAADPFSIRDRIHPVDQELGSAVCAQCGSRRQRPDHSGAPGSHPIEAENRQLRLEREILSNACPDLSGGGGLVRSGDERDPCEGFRFVSDHQAGYPIVTMCKLLGVSSSGYYAWRKRQPSQRSETDAALVAEIQVAHAGSRGTYGVPRIHAELAAKGTYIGRKRVARLMTQAGLAGASRHVRGSRCDG